MKADQYAILILAVIFSQFVGVMAMPRPDYDLKRIQTEQEWQRKYLLDIWGDASFTKDITTSLYRAGCSR